MDKSSGPYFYLGCFALIIGSIINAANILLKINNFWIDMVSLFFFCVALVLCVINWIQKDENKGSFRIR